MSVGGVSRQWHPGAGDGVGLQGGEGFGEAGGQGHDAQRKPLGLGEIRRIGGGRGADPDRRLAVLDPEAGEAAAPVVGAQGFGAMSLKGVSAWPATASPGRSPDTPPAEHGDAVCRVHPGPRCTGILSAQTDAHRAGNGDGAWFVAPEPSVQRSLMPRGAKQEAGRLSPDHGETGPGPAAIAILVNRDPGQSRSWSMAPVPLE